LAALPALALLMWAEARSVQPLAAGRKRALLVVRALLVLLSLVALASPARVVRSEEQAAIMVVDESASLGRAGIATARAAAEEIRASWPGSVPVGAVAVGARARLIAEPTTAREKWKWDAVVVDPSQTNLADGVALAQGLFPPGTARHVVVVSDGQENRGSLEEAARRAAAAGVHVHTVAVAGEARSDVRVTQLVASQTRITEGATVEITASVESSLSGKGRIRLFENGLQVDERPLEMAVGETREVRFSRAPETRNSYTYRAVVEGFTDDAIAENNEALALIDVRGKPLILYVEGEPAEARYLTEAMDRMGLRLEVRTPATMPQALRELTGYDAVILSDVPAHQLGDPWMAALRDYVGKLGGGFIMIGGMNSFGVGG
jgi:Ca-activated chloride channel family protein